MRDFLIECEEILLCELEIDTLPQSVSDLLWDLSGEHCGCGYSVQYTVDQVLLSMRKDVL